MYGDQWTADRVIVHLVEAFRRLPGTPIRSEVSGRLEPALWDRPVEGASLILATGRYLGPRSLERRQLLAYTRCKGTGCNVAELCRLEGWPRASLYRHVTRAAERVAAGLNRDSAQATCQ